MGILSVDDDMMVVAGQKVNGLGKLDDYVIEPKMWLHC